MTTPAPRKTAAKKAATPRAKSSPGAAARRARADDAVAAAPTSRQGQKPQRAFRAHDDVWEPAMARVRAYVNEPGDTTFTVVVPAGTKYLSDVLELALKAYAQAD